MKENYYFDAKDRFVIEDYNDKKPFSSFLPGIAGLKGTPLWSFYVNRGQVICSFGVRDKNSSIMEFYPAYKAYQNVDYTGFRTFIKIKNNDDIKYYEPFSNINQNSKLYNKLYIGANECEIEEIDEDECLKINILYFTLPEENIAALVRKTTIVNTSDKELELEILDGMPAVIPYGLDNAGLKEVGHTLRAWMDVYNLENRIPFYKVRASTGDTAEVSSIEEGNFYICFTEEENAAQLLKPIVDIDVVFGNNKTLSYPTNFMKEDLKALYKKKQITVNKVPSGFFGVEKTLAPGKAIDLYSLIGHVDNIEILNNIREEITSKKYIENKYNTAEKLVRELTENISTNTASRLFDEYCRQTYLDNLLRGGYPLVIGDGKVYHVYSRKHGDLERDYNFFITEPEYFSCGNGNYRDVNQNRRNDAYFNPAVKDFNIVTFMNLIQLDGYNPLVLNGYKFSVKKDSERAFMDLVSEDSRVELEKFISKEFTLGKLYKFLTNKKIKLSTDIDTFVNKLLEECEQIMEAIHGEGYWSDHWTYNLDLIESFLSIYPDEKKELLLERKNYTYFDNSVFVHPRAEKYVLTDKGVRQYNAVEHDKEKEAFIKSRSENKNIVRTDYGRGEIYKSNLFSKLIALVVNKYSLLDPMGMGVEMEAGKPGWDDALNGLPGLFGSSMAESYELQRLLDFTLYNAKEYGEETIKLPIEICDLMEKISSYIDEFNKSRKENKNHIYWDKVSSCREEYREKIKYGICGEEIELKLNFIQAHIEKYSYKLKKAIDKAFNENNDIYPTYFYYEAEEYEFLYDNQGNKKVNVNRFIQRKLPLFLEGSARALKINNKEMSRQIYNKVKHSELFDERLKMYKLNESLEGQSIEIGRLKAFTPGWLENETIWLHMEYKYILEILKNGLYDEFFNDFKEVLIPFLDAEAYGRSPLENCSFIASSSNPDETVHGTGFVARLSGAAAEFLSIWNIMMAGHKPFYMKDNKLCLGLKPILPYWLFDDENRVSFNFLGNTKVIYHNENRVNTYKDCSAKSIIIEYADGSKYVIDNGEVTEPYSSDIRKGKISEINIVLE